MKDKTLKQLKKEWELVGKQESYRLFIKGDMSGPMNVEANFDDSGKVDVDFIQVHLVALGFNLSKIDMLEIGCGAGRMGLYFDKIFRRYIGIDISSSIIGQARSRCPKVDFRVADSLRKFKSKSIDVIFSYATFQHMPKWCVRKYFKEGLRVLGENGVIIFQLPIGIIKGTTPRYASGEGDLYNSTSFRDWTQEEFDDLTKNYRLVDKFNMNDTSTFFIVQK